MQTWLPTIVSGLALGTLFFFLRSSRAENRKAIKAIKLKMEKNEKETEKKMETEYLKASAYTLLCENQALKMRKFFQT